MYYLIVASGSSSVLDFIEDDFTTSCVTECTKNKRRSKQGTEAGPFLDFSVYVLFYSTTYVEYMVELYVFMV